MTDRVRPEENGDGFQMDNEFTGPFPRYSGAITAVTEGAPEDMNEMPALLNNEGSYSFVSFKVTKTKKEVSK
jgi:hypothetical protein